MIIHITPVFSPYASGMTSVVRKQTRELAMRGHSVVVITPRYGDKWPEEENIDGVHVNRVTPLLKMGNGAFAPSMISRLRSYIATSRGNVIVHLHLPFFGMYELLWAFRKFGALKNAKLITLYHHDPQLTGITRILGLPSKLVFGSLVTSSDVVISSSKDYAEHSEIKSFIGKCKFKEIPFGVDNDRFVPGKTENKERGKVNILFVGAMDKAHHFKGVDILLKAVSRLKFKNYKLNIVGKGDLLEEYKSLAKSLNIDDNVYFAGFVPDDELPRYHAQADLFVFPSTGRAEAFGMVALEAMSAGLPVIASDLPGVRSLIGRDDMLVEPGSVNMLARKIDLLLHDKEMRDRIGGENREKVLSKYTWKKVVDELESAYER